METCYICMKNEIEIFQNGEDTPIKPYADTGYSLCDDCRLDVDRLAAHQRAASKNAEKEFSKWKNS